MQFKYLVELELNNYSCVFNKMSDVWSFPLGLENKKDEKIYFNSICVGWSGYMNSFVKRNDLN